jgi:8-oxo-dGTP diphosphatase
VKKQINVVGAAVVRDGTVLSAQRSSSMSLPGMWEFPGGKIEAGETPQEALRREMEEELLCKIQVGEHVETTSHEYDFGIVTLTTFYATLLDGEPKLTEHSAIRWIPAADLDSVEWAPADVPAVDRIMRDFAA